MERIIWAKYKTSPWWPAKIEQDEENESENKVMVHFYEEGCREIINRSRVKPYAENKTNFARQKLSPTMTLRLKIAIKQADTDMEDLSEQDISTTRQANPNKTSPKKASPVCAASPSACIEDTTNISKANEPSSSSKTENGRQSTKHTPSAGTPTTSAKTRTDSQKRKSAKTANNLKQTKQTKSSNAKCKTETDILNAPTSDNTMSPLLKQTPKSQLTVLKAPRSAELPKKAHLMKRLVLTPPVALQRQTRQSPVNDNLLAVQVHKAKQSRQQSPSQAKRSKVAQNSIKQTIESDVVSSPSKRKVKNIQAPLTLPAKPTRAQAKLTQKIEKMSSSINSTVSQSAEESINYTGSISQESQIFNNISTMSKSRSTATLKSSPILRAPARRSCGGRSVSTKCLNSAAIDLQAQPQDKNTAVTDLSASQCGPAFQDVEEPSSPLAQSSQVISQRSTVSGQQGENDLEGSHSDEELPCYDYILKGPEFTMSVGEVIWAKFRSYPQWPCLITRLKSKKAAVKFINSDNLANGIWMTTKGISAYPGDHYFDYVAAARETAYNIAVQRAVKMADHFLNLKADGSDVTPFKHFFPQQEDTVLSDLESSDDDDMELDGDLVRREADDSIIDEDSEEKTEYTAVKPANKEEYSEETKQKIEERENWLRKVFDTIKNNKERIAAMIKDGEASHSQITEKRLWTGPLALSTTGLEYEILKLVISEHRAIVGTIHMAEWCFTSVIPKAIIEAIMEVDKTTFPDAKEKFFSDMMTSEEDIRYQKQIHKSAQNVSEEDKQIYQMLLDLDSP